LKWLFVGIFSGVETLEIYWERREYAKGGHKDAGAEMVGYLQ